MSHKVEISERFKSHRLEFKGQSSCRKKLMNENLMEKTLTVKWAHWCSIACLWRFSNVRLFQLYGTDYIVSPIKLHRYRTFQRSKLKFKTCRYLAKHCPFACPELLERPLALQLYGTYYSLSHKVETSERSKNSKNVQLNINMVI